MPRFVRALLRVLCAALVLSVLGASTGCWWVAGQAALSLLPVVTERNAPPSAPSDRPLAPVPDAGQSWRRRVTGVDGQPLTSERYHAGDPVHVTWEIPVQIGQRVDAVAAVQERACRTAGAPSRWALRTASGMAQGGEAWSFQSSGATGPGVVGMLDADALRAHLGLTPAAPLAWLLLVPAPGKYVLTIDWDTSDIRALEATSPCVAGWVAVPLAWAIAATRTAPETKAVGVAPAPRVPNTSDAGVGLAAPGAPPQTGSPAAISAPRAPIDYAALVSRTLGLLRAPSYDLVRLHQAALDLEFAPATTLAIAPDGTPVTADEPAVRTALVDARAASLSALRAGGTEGQLALCTLVHQGLGARPLRIWNDEATVPRGDQKGCH
jgi:hypothetical protein